MLSHMSHKRSKLRKPTIDEQLLSAISNVNAITNQGVRSRSKTIKKKNASRDIVLQRNEDGQRIIHKPRQSTPSNRNTQRDEEMPTTSSDLRDVPQEMLCDDNVTERDLEAILESCQLVIGEVDTGPSAWQKRMENREENWESMREKIFNVTVSSFAPPLSAMKCSRCNENEAVLRCRQCGVLRYICRECDDDVHENNPLHDREVWLDGYFQYIKPTQSISSDGKICSIDRSCPILYPSSCQLCNEPIIKTTNSSLVIMITCEGRFDLNWFTVHCSSCQWKWSPISVDSIIESGWWPGSPENFHYIFSQDVFNLWDAFRKRMPGSSQSAFVRSLEDISSSRGRENVINSVTFRKSFAEWSYCQHEIDLLHEQTWKNCPPCSIDQHSCHIDGNQKCTDSAKGPVQCYYRDVLIANNSFVDSHLKSLGSKSIQNEDNSCGDTHWKAAKMVSKSKKNQDETGLEVAGCRHSIAQATLNMFRGEIYGYAHYLHMNFLQPHKVKYMWEDIICKYWPWALRVTSEENQNALKNIAPALSIMHGKSHSWSCQVIWSGRWQSGAAATAGEEVEQINSYLSRLGSTTKNMTASGEYYFLICISTQTERKLSSARDDFVKLRSELNVQDSDLDDSIMQWKEEVQQFAREQQIGVSSLKGAAEEFFLCIKLLKMLNIWRIL
ncbi:uncharacterized protein LOC124456981 [Xenia sp. Carnegie-2017]|uniref:uncharacterized protein LOC124456981 n=1 Tax=Xenia sp. Carnegie-2017 TaxID=2897299 RepID=UPI001F041736|nr:uncharacterized protein LOC124456981 [Xenia sp. Carnegie-2017]